MLSSAFASTTLAARYVPRRVGAPLPEITGVSFPGRARRGTSGALYLQSAIAGLNPLPRSPFSNAARRVTLRTGSRAAANREPCQVRKEAALSDHRRVPRNGLVRAARHGGHEQRPGRRRVHGNLPAVLPMTEEAVTSTVPHQALYRRWRAQTFGEIVGQEAVVETLRNAVRTDRVSHAVLFVGPRGTGKTSLARILAKAVNCTDLQDGDACDKCPSCVSIREGTSLDLVEIDAASNRGIDDVRGLRERLAYPPGQLKRKVYILDEAHQITGPAWNALLKSIEEPPDFVIFMFASTEPSAFPPAILSRLQRYDVRRLTVAEIEGKLARILAADGRGGRAGRGPPHRPACRRRDARRRVDARPAALRGARADRRGARSRPSRPGRRTPRSSRHSSTISSAATGRPGSRCSTRSRSAAGTFAHCSTRPSRPSVPSSSQASPIRPQPDMIRPPSSRQPGVSRPSIRIGPGSAASGSAWSSPCSPPSQGWTRPRAPPRGRSSSLPRDPAHNRPARPDPGRRHPDGPTSPPEPRTSRPDRRRQPP